MSRGKIRIALRRARQRRAQAKSVLLLAVMMLLAACGGNPGNSNDSHTEEEAPITRGVAPEPDAEVAVIETDYGSPIVIELYPNIAPRHVERFKQLSRENF